jgi:hypothetical protein
MQSFSGALWLQVTRYRLHVVIQLLLHDLQYLKQVLDIFVLPNEFLLHRMPDHLIKQNYIIKKLKTIKF